MRLYCLGDSLTFGCGIAPAKRWNGTYVMVMADRLDDMLRGLEGEK